MKSIIKYTSVFLFVLACMQARAQSPMVDSVSFSTPEATFEVLLRAIKTKDIELYKQCWDPDRLEWEGIAGSLTEVPGQWEMLQGLVKGDVKLVMGNESVGSGDRRMMEFSVSAPEVEKGLDHATLVLNGDKWQMYSW